MQEIVSGRTQTLDLLRRGIHLYICAPALPTELLLCFFFTSFWPVIITISVSKTLEKLEQFIHNKHSKSSKIKLKAEEVRLQSLDLRKVFF